MVIHMKKIVSCTLIAVMLMSVCSSLASANYYLGYSSMVQSTVSNYGLFEQTGDGVATGLIYAELIDFDSNGVEEMVLVYKDKQDNTAWANIAVYGQYNGMAAKLLDMPIGAGIRQLDNSYFFGYKYTDNKICLFFNTTSPSTGAGRSEKVVVFNIDNGTVAVDEYYGEAANWQAASELAYSACALNGEVVSAQEYSSALSKLYSEATRTYLLPSDRDSEKEKYLSIEKLSTFLSELKIRISETAATAAPEISVMLNGIKLEFDVLPQIIDNRTLVPMRTIFEALGCEITWNSEKQSILAVRDDREITMVIGHTEMYLYDKLYDGNSRILTLDVPPQIINDRTLVPVRAISEALNCMVEWNSDAQTVVITPSV